MQTVMQINNGFVGLTDDEASIRLKLHGANILSSAKPRHFLTIIWSSLREPMFLLLLACGALYFVLGDFAEAAILLVAILAVITITIVQEHRTERTLDALKDLASPRAIAIRNGVRKRIAGKDVVPGDVIILAEGDRIPADGFVRMEDALRIDESLLTGESVPVSKIPWDEKATFTATSGDDTPYVLAGTLVVQGSGIMQVHATGQSTTMGKIGQSIHDTKRPKSLLQADIQRAVTFVAALSLSISTIIALVWWLRDHQALRGILMGLTFAMGTIPEEFPVVLTIFMALGAWRISKRKVLTRQMHAIETLGSATILCVDKTGTITENRMTLSALWVPRGEIILLDNTTQAWANDQRDLLTIACLASDPSGSDPMDVSVIERAHPFLGSIHNQFQLMKSYPLVRPLLAVGSAWRGEAKKDLLAIKGAPESIVHLCRMSEEQRDAILQSVQRLAANGLRVLGVAYAQVHRGALPDALDGCHCTFSGLIGFSDPLKSGVAAAVKECQTAGIRIMMMTGDYPATAAAIAQQIGLATPDGVLTGSDIEALSEHALTDKLKTVQVLARMVPEQKLRVVQSLQAAGEVVAMTGDGVNDAPALKAAHIGIAMGDRGTDVAREAAALVLLDDNFTSIVAAIRLGRRVYDNIQKAVGYIIAIHVPIVGLTLLPLSLGNPPILWAVHIAFFELVIDPVCSIVFEAETEEAAIMQRRPRPLNGRIFNRSMITANILRGLLAFVAIMLLYAWVGQRAGSLDHARSVAFVTLIFLNIALILTLRTRDVTLWNAMRRPSKAFAWVGAAVLGITAIVLYVPPLTRLFHFVPPHGADMAACAGISLLVLFVMEAGKMHKKVRA